MLVDLRARQVVQVDDVARAHHGVGEPRRFLRRHSPPKNRHEQRRRLVVREFPVHDAAREEFDLVLRQRATVALLDDDVLRKKGHVQVES